MRKRVTKLFSRFPLQMITLDTYAQHVYQYAPSATTEHLRRTVWEPLGLSPQSSSTGDVNVAPAAAASSHASLYAVAPVTTNVRCVGADIQPQLESLVGAACLSPPAANHRDDNEETSFPMSPIGATASRYAPPFTFAKLGLPFCACVQPHVRLLAQWPPTFPLDPPHSTAPAGVTAAAAVPPPSSSCVDSADPLVIVVDAGAAEAVLRGSDLYAPGIVTASRVFFAGEEALVAFFAERVLDGPADSSTDNAHKGTNNKNYIDSVLPGVKKVRGEGSLATPPAESAGEAKRENLTSSLFTAHGSAPWRIVSGLTAGITLPPAQYTPLRTPAETSAAALAPYSTFLVCIGSGRLFMGWKDVLGRRTRGVALRTDWTPQLQPSRATLRRLLNTASPTSSPAAAVPDAVAAESGGGLPEEEPHDVFFLQNYSSMVPVAMLVEHLPRRALRRPCTVLDACAAPGGKTSLLLSLLQSRANRKDKSEEEEGKSTTAVAGTEASTEAGTHPPFRVVCCERSRPRQEQLLKLLQQHFPSYEDDASKESFLSQVLEPHCADTNKYLKKQLAAASATTAVNSAESSPAGLHADTFDGILLDPPCTGLGLRPKLLPHPHSIASIQQSADYQRKLFDSCVRHLRGSPGSPGVLVYSTCTTTLEENEANVLHFLRTYPTLRLARATTAAHHALCKMSVTKYPHLCEAGAPCKSDSGADSASSLSSSPLPMVLLAREIAAVQQEKEAAAARATAPGAASVPSQEAPLLVLRFMPRHLAEYDSPCEDSVGFFVAVFLFPGPLESRS